MYQCVRTQTLNDNNAYEPHQKHIKPVDVFAHFGPMITQ